MWEQIKQPEDISWVEWHREMMTYEFGRCMLKVWETMDGYFMASATKPNGDRAIKALEASDIETAKNEAERWLSFGV